MTISNQRHLIGYVHSTQGLQGEMFLVLKSIDTSWLDIWDELILAPANITDPEVADFLSFTIRSLRLHKKQGKQGLVARLKTLTDVDQAATYVGYSVWIPEEFLQSKEGEAIFLKEIEGFTVIDESLGEIGPIEGFSSNGPQDLIEVSYNGQTRFVPLVKAFIVSVDKKNKKLFMRIPDGLLEI